jgi:hypothetical protein
LSPLNEKPKPTMLASANALLRAVVSELETNVNTPTKEWSSASRRVSMQQLFRTASQAKTFLDEGVEEDLRIKNAGKLVGCLECIISTAFLAGRDSMQTRCWGRTYLKYNLADLKNLLGDGVTIEEQVPMERPSGPQPFITVPHPLPYPRQRAA